MMERRPAESYGDIKLSVQASSGHYCTPRVSGLPLHLYKSVEVAILRNGEFISPKDIGAPELEGLFVGDQVAGWVEWDYVEKIREAIRRHVGMDDLEATGPAGKESHEGGN